tara:strand:+ start:14339 stop:14680 length:342 start_codon:yes stop_codon:yes gene_type:complete
MSMMTIDHLKKLKEWRGPRQRPSVYQVALERIQRDAKRTHRHLGDFIEHWYELLPDEIAVRTNIDSVRGGTIYVRADNSAVAFEVDRFLREGALANLRRCCSITVADIKVRVR